VDDTSRLSCDGYLRCIVNLAENMKGEPLDYAQKIYHWLRDNMPEELEHCHGQPYIDGYAIKVAIYSLGWESAA